MNEPGGMGNFSADAMHREKLHSQQTYRTNDCDDYYLLQ
jgi:hypothetical protein